MKTFSHIHARVSTYINELSHEMMKQEICDVVGITMSQFKSKSRQQNVCFARYCYANARKRKGVTLKQTGIELGGYNHSTIIHHLKVFQNEIDHNPLRLEQWNRIKIKL